MGAITAYDKSIKLSTWCFAIKKILYAATISLTGVLQFNLLAKRPVHLKGEERTPYGQMGTKVLYRHLKETPININKNSSEGDPSLNPPEDSQLNSNQNNTGENLDFEDNQEQNSSAASNGGTDTIGADNTNSETSGDTTGTDSPPSAPDASDNPNADDTSSNGATPNSNDNTDNPDNSAETAIEPNLDNTNAVAVGMAAPVGLNAPSSGDPADSDGSNNAEATQPAAQPSDSSTGDNNTESGADVDGDNADTGEDDQPSTADNALNASAGQAENSQADTNRDTDGNINTAPDSASDATEQSPESNDAEDDASAAQTQGDEQQDSTPAPDTGASAEETNNGAEETLSLETSADGSPGQTDTPETDGEQTDSTDANADQAVAKDNSAADEAQTGGAAQTGTDGDSANQNSAIEAPAATEEVVETEAVAEEANPEEPTEEQKLADAAIKHLTTLQASIQEEFAIPSKAVTIRFQNGRCCTENVLYSEMRWAPMDVQDFLAVMDEMHDAGLLPDADGKDVEDPENSYVKTAKQIHIWAKQMVDGTLDPHTYDDHTTSFTAVAVALLTQKLNEDKCIWQNPREHYTAVYWHAGNIHNFGRRSIDTLRRATNHMFTATQDQEVRDIISKRFYYAFENETSGGRFAATGTLACMLAMFAHKDNDWAQWAERVIHPKGDLSAWYNVLLKQVLDKLFPNEIH